MTKSRERACLSQILRSVNRKPQSQGVNHSLSTLSQNHGSDHREHRADEEDECEAGVLLRFTTTPQS